MSEANLISKCLENNGHAQYQLYERYKDAMFTLAYRITGDFGAAEDVLQEAFVKVFKNLHSFKGLGTLGSWIKTIVIRQAYAQMKRKKIKFEELTEFSQNQNVHIDYHDIDIQYLEKSINQLPPGYRTVFTLIEIEGYTHKEAAELLGISVGTSKSQLFYAKKHLRKSIQKFL